MPRVLSLAILAAALTIPNLAFAQVGGVYIDAKGMLRQTAALSQDARLKMLQAQAVVQPKSRILANGSSLRKLSLKHLEAAVVRALKDPNVGGDYRKLPAELRYLAGMTRLQYVFFDPANKDVLIAGQAEGWKQSPTGEVVGTKTGRPVLHLEDLIAALRYAFDTNQKSFIGCSIDPTAEGFKRYAAYMRSLKRIDRSRVRQIFAGMERAMGPQAVRVFGVESNSRFALALVAADYRLKRIAMAHDRSPVKQVVSYLDIASRGRLSTRQPQHRWWFVAKYDAIQHTPDKLAYELIGQGVHVQTDRAASTKTKNGRRPKATGAAKQFSASFTKYYPALAKQVPVFAELQNLIALSVAAELIAQRHFDQGEPGGVSPGRANAATSTQSSGLRRDARLSHWKPSAFLNTKKCVLPKYVVPKTTPSLASYRLVRGRQWLISVSGGVEINPRTIAKTTKSASAGANVVEISKSIKSPKDAGKWWWD